MNVTTVFPGYRADAASRNPGISDSRGTDHARARTPYPGDNNRRDARLNVTRSTPEHTVFHTVPSFPGRPMIGAASAPRPESTKRRTEEASMVARNGSLIGRTP